MASGKINYKTIIRRFGLQFKNFTVTLSPAISIPANSSRTILDSVLATNLGMPSPLEAFFVEFIQSSVCIPINAQVINDGTRIFLSVKNDSSSAASVGYIVLGLIYWG